MESVGELISTGNKILPMLIIFPFDTSSNLGFAFGFLLLIYGYETYWLANVTSDRLIYGIITLIALEFRKLKIKFAEIKFYSGNDLRKELKILIQRHNELFESVKEIQNIFGVSFFLNFLTSSLFICFNLFLFTTAKDSEKASSSIMFVVFSAFVIFLQCIFGQMLKDESNDVLNGIMESKWENINDVCIKKDIVMLIRRIQKPIELSIMNISSINIEQFGNVLTTSYSYFTICRRLYS